jgi:hypothetical protein
MLYFDLRQNSEYTAGHKLYKTRFRHPILAIMIKKPKKSVDSSLKDRKQLAFQCYQADEMFQQLNIKVFHVVFYYSFYVSFINNNLS